MIKVYRTSTKSEYSISRLILISPIKDDDEGIADFATKVAFGNTVEGDLVEFSDDVCFYFVAGQWWCFERFNDGDDLDVTVYPDDDDDTIYLDDDDHKLGL